MEIKSAPLRSHCSIWSNHSSNKYVNCEFKKSMSIHCAHYWNLIRLLIVCWIPETTMWFPRVNYIEMHVVLTRMNCIMSVVLGMRRPKHGFSCWCGLHSKAKFVICVGFVHVEFICWKCFAPWRRADVDSVQILLSTRFAKWTFGSGMKYYGQHHLTLENNWLNALVVFCQNTAWSYLDKAR